MLYVWKENLMLTNCLAACAHLTITVFEIDWDIGRKSSIFHTSFYSMPPLGGGSHRNITTPFDMEKLEWCGYPVVKNIWRYLYSFSRNYERDGHRMTAYTALMHMHHAVKMTQVSSVCSSNVLPITVKLWKQQSKQIAFVIVNIQPVKSFSHDFVLK